MTVRLSFTDTSRRGRRRLAATALLGAAMLVPSLAGAGSVTAAPALGPALPTSPAQLAADLMLPTGERALVDVNGHAMVIAADGSVTYRQLHDEPEYGNQPLRARPDKDEMIAQLRRSTAQPYAPGELVVVFAAGVQVGVDARPAAATAASAFTADRATDQLLARLGAEQPRRVLAPASDSALSAAREAAERATGQPLVDIGRAYTFSLSGADPRDAAAQLLALPTVEYASPAWAVTGPADAATMVPATVVDAVTGRASRSKAPGGPTPRPVGGGGSLPTNYGLVANAQSHWNSPALDAASAYHQVVDRFAELPGAGETITTVGVGPLTSDPTGPCAGDVDFVGPTTTVIDGQRYLDLPAMPLIPTFTADESGALDPLGEACPESDPFLQDVGLSLSVMAPLPHDQQRPEALGDGLTDLLGLAPGADYRLVVPASNFPTITDLAGALVGASQQEPAPTVITTSARVGGTDVGFPSRYLEEDYLLRSVITTIVHGRGITVAAGAGDGTTTRTPAAIGPSGGAVAVDVVEPGTGSTRLSDLTLSTAPARIPDSGAITAGATTLNDIFAAPPHGSDDPATDAQQAYPAVRWTGSTAYASSFGSRVDIAAPADSIVSFSHAAGGGPRDVDIQLGAGTTAAAAQVAAAAAVVRQVSRLTGAPLTDPTEIRDFLVDTGRPVPGVPQASPAVPVGPQLDLGAAVTTLLTDAGLGPEPGVLRTAVAQRRSVAGHGAVFETWTDPAAIDLAGPASPFDGQPTGRNTKAWITIAPDWVGLPADATYELVTDGGVDALAGTPSARLLPETILAAAGLPLVSTEPRSVTLEYRALGGGDILASQQITLTFGPADGSTEQVLAPVAPPVVASDTITVSYDLRDVEPVQDPELVVSFPGRLKPEIGPVWVPALRIPLAELHGTVDVPVADLQGGGIYGIGVHHADLVDEFGFTVPLYSDFGFVRVQTTQDARPPAPRVSNPQPNQRVFPVHSLRIEDGGTVTVTWDARSVPGAAGALLEVSAAGPTLSGLLNTFNNPDGTERDDNGNDTGSVTLLELPGVAGTKTLPAAELGLYSTMTHGLRILPVDKAGTVVGAASPVSSVGMNGVQVPNGGTVEEGYGIDPVRGRGYLTSYWEDVNDNWWGDVHSFDLATKQVTAELRAEGAADSYYRALGFGTFDDTGLVQHRPQLFGAPPVGQWALPDLVPPATAWTPPEADRYVVERAGSDPSDGEGVILLRDTEDTSSGPFRLVSSDVRANTFGPVHDISAPLQDQPFAPTLMSVAYDATAGVAAAAFTSDPFGTPIVEAIDPATGEVTVIEHERFGMVTGLDVLSSGKVVFSTLDYQISVADLSTGETTSTQLPALGIWGTWVAADDENGLVFVGQASGPGNGEDKNSLAAVHVFDEDLQLVETIRRFNLNLTLLAPWVNQIQVDPAARTGWFVGPRQQQLATFDY